MVDEAEDETNPRELGGEVDAMSEIREKKQHIISKMRITKVADSPYVEKKPPTHSDL